jgi:hypothetical protein
MGNPHNTLQTEQSLFINFVSTHQVAVITKVPQEPPEFPKRFGGAVEATGEGAALMFSWFEDRKVQGIERPLRMPAIKGSIDPDQEDAFQSVITFMLFTMQTSNMTFHGATSCGLA